MERACITSIVHSSVNLTGYNFMLSGKWGIREGERECGRERWKAWGDKERGTEKGR